jgi:hypothetical protein
MGYILDPLDLGLVIQFLIKFINLCVNHRDFFI